MGNVEEDPIRRDPEGLFDGDKDNIAVIGDGEWEVEIIVLASTFRHVKS